MRQRVAIALATLSGFVALSYEILWIRVFSYIAWGKAWSFGVLLGAYLTGLAGGAVFARRYCARDRGELRALAWFLVGANLLGFLLVPGVAELGRYASIFWTLPAVALVAALLGTALPLIAHFGIPAGDRVGSRLSYLYLGNILGSAAGSLLTGFLFMDLWPLRTISVFLLLTGLAMAAGVSFLGALPRRRSFLAAMAAASVVAALFAPHLYAGVYEKMQFKDEYVAGYRFVHVYEGKSGVITVTREGIVYGDGVYDGCFNVSLEDDRNDIIRAYSIAALHPAPRRMLVVGLGSGSWAQVLAHHPALEEMIVIEINPGYVELLDHSPVTRSLRTNPKVTFVVDDGRRWLARHEERFDLIVQNTTYHFRSHATNLLSREYFELCRERLRPGGLMMYNTTWSKEAARTGADVFPHVWMVVNNMVCGDAPFAPDRARWRRLLEAYRLDGRPLFDFDAEAGRAAFERVLAFPEIRDATDLDTRRKGFVPRETLLAWAADAQVITDDNMASEFR